MADTLTRDKVIRHIHECLEWYARDVVANIVNSIDGVMCCASEFSVVARKEDVSRLVSVAVRWADVKPEGFPHLVFLTTEEAVECALLAAEAYNAESRRRYELGTPTVCGKTVDTHPEWPTCVCDDNCHDEEL